MCICGIVWGWCEQEGKQSLFNLAYTLFTTTYSSDIICEVFYNLLGKSHSMKLTEISKGAAEITTDRIAEKGVGFPANIWESGAASETRTTCCGYWQSLLQCIGKLSHSDICLGVIRKERIGLLLAGWLIFLLKSSLFLRYNNER